MQQLAERKCYRKVLLVEDDKVFCNAFQCAIRKLNIDLECINSLDAAEHALDSNSYAMVLLDTEMNGQKTASFSQTIAKKKPLIKIISLVKRKALNDIPSCLHEGSSNVIPLELGVDAITSEMNRTFDEQGDSDTDSLDYHYPKIIGTSEFHVRILEKIHQVKDVSASVLVTGESGTGKELVARALHEASNRNQSRFEAINCAAVPENLLESELFGHKRGAFTDAKTEKKGIFELCTNGTLLLDEIGEMPLNLQVKLLRVLQEREIRPLGGTSSVKIGTRIVAATNKDLKQEVEKGTFRQDLYYRLSVLKIHIQPLRERSEDIAILAKNFLEDFSNEHGKFVYPFTECQMTRLQYYPWKGNIRELRNSIERGVILSKNGRIRLEDIFEEGEEDCFRSQAGEGMDHMPRNYKEAKHTFETKYLQCLLKDASGNVSEAARMAGKTRVEIYRFINRNAINPADFR